VNFHGIPADIAGLFVIFAFLVVVGDIVPIAMYSYFFMAMLTGLDVPLRFFLLDTFLVGLRRIIPVTVDFQRSVADIAGYFVPCALFVVGRRVIPCPVNSHGFVAVTTASFVPLTFFMVLRDVIPIAMNSDWFMAVFTAHFKPLIPSLLDAVLAYLWLMVPILVDVE
jgi:hypothetical protein